MTAASWPSSSVSTCSPGTKGVRAGVTGLLCCPCVQAQQGPRAGGVVNAGAVFGRRLLKPHEDPGATGPNLLEPDQGGRQGPRTCASPCRSSGMWSASGCILVLARSLLSSSAGS